MHEMWEESSTGDQSQWCFLQVSSMEIKKNITRTLFSIFFFFLKIYKMVFIGVKIQWIRSHWCDNDNPTDVHTFHNKTIVVWFKSATMTIQ